MGIRSAGIRHEWALLCSLCVVIVSLYVMRVAALLLLMCTGFTAVSCAPAVDDAGFDSPSPQTKMQAITAAARDNDRTAVADLIEQLLSDDPAVRFTAIETLKQLTGETFGYRHYDDAAQRRQAIDRWVQAYETGGFD